MDKKKNMEKNLNSSLGMKNEFYWTTLLNFNEVSYS